MHGQLAAKLVEVAYNSGHEKLIEVLQMVERHVLVFLLSNKTVIQGRVLSVILLFQFLLGHLTEILRCYV